mgnify:CR=1 FL=1
MFYGINKKINEFKGPNSSTNFLDINNPSIIGNGIDNVDLVSIQ